MQETRVQSLGQEDPWRREWQPPPVFLPGEFHGQGSMAGDSPWDRKESDTAEQLTLSVSIFYCSRVDFCCCVLGLQELESVIHRHISILLWGLFPNRFFQLLRRLPCANSRSFRIYLIVSSAYMSVLNSQCSPSPTFLKKIIISWFSKFVSLFLFIN